MHHAIGVHPTEAAHPFLNFLDFEFDNNKNDVQVEDIPSVKGRKFDRKKWVIDHDPQVCLDEYFSNIEDIIQDCKNLEHDDVDDKPVPKKDAKKYKDPDQLLAIGCCGLDYSPATLANVDKRTQKEVFEKHFNLSITYQLPMYITSTNANQDVLKILEKNQKSFWGGVITNFQGTEEEMFKFMKLGCLIGISGDSLRSRENCLVLKKVPHDMFLLQTNSPYSMI